MKHASCDTVLAVAIDADWSAPGFSSVEFIKSASRKSAQ